MPLRQFSGISCLFVFLSASLSLRAATPAAGVDFSSPAQRGWSVEDPARWETADSTLRMTAPGDSTGRWLNHWLRLDSARTRGDFTLHTTAGFSGAAYPMENDSTYSWKIYYRALAFGIVADSANALLATFCRTNGDLNGILRLKDGKEIWLCRPYSGQGVGLDVHDQRYYRMTREGRKIIVWAGHAIVYMALDTLDGALPEGLPTVCGPGPVGLAVSNLSVSPDWHGPMASHVRPLPEVGGPPEISNLTLHFEQGWRGLYLGPLNTAFSVEEGAIAGLRLSEVVEGGAAPGAHSWAAMGGQLNVQNYMMGPEATIETWFKLVEAPEAGLPLVQLIFDGSTQDSSLGSRERGGPMVFHYPDSSLGLHFHEFGDITFDLPDVFRLNEWTHLAWVRRGKRHTIYVNGRSVISFEMPRYGERALHGIQLTLGQNADHDWITTPGRVYALFDCLQVTDRALTPEEFVDPQALAAPFVRPYGTNPFSPSELILLFKVEAGKSRRVAVKCFDKEGRELFTSYEGALKPGNYNFVLTPQELQERFKRSGTYFFRCYADGDMILERKWILLR
ncbi:LamG domain-containing protein [bacterium]|nr:LamG domain-containing protein [bacterium]